MAESGTYKRFDHNRGLEIDWSVSDGCLRLIETVSKDGRAKIKYTAIPCDALRAALNHMKQVQ